MKLVKVRCDALADHWRNLLLTEHRAGGIATFVNWAIHCFPTLIVMSAHKSTSLPFIAWQIKAMLSWPRALLPTLAILWARNYLGMSKKGSFVIPSRVAQNRMILRFFVFAAFVVLYIWHFVAVNYVHLTVKSADLHCHWVKCGKDPPVPIKSPLLYAVLW